MQSIMKVVKSVVNIVRAQGLNHRQFRQLLEASDWELEDISYHKRSDGLVAEKLLNSLWQ